MKKFAVIFLILLSVPFLHSAPAQTETVLYLTISDNGAVRCTFGEVEGCRIYSLPVTFTRDNDGGLNVQIADDGISEVLPGVPAVMPSVNPSGDLLAFMAAADSGEFKFRHIYVFNLNTGAVTPITDGQTFNSLGQWPRWLSDNQLVFSNFNDCQTRSDDPGCNRNSRYQDLYVATLSPDGQVVQRVEMVLGGINPEHGLDTRFCNGEDPAPVPGNPSLVTFHSTSVDGETDVHGDECPWLQGFGGLELSENANAFPVVMALDANSPDGTAAGFVAGEDYWPFDLASAGINGCAHLDFSDDGQIAICTEQGSARPYRECSTPELSGPQCIQSGAYSITYNRIFGFVLDGDIYRNIHQDNPTAPLFQHLSPFDLPDVERYWNAEAQCAFYLTKYAEFGPDNVLLATVLCRGESQDVGDTPFSRLMLIDIADLVHPVYFDLTGWLEERYPERWGLGQATGFLGSFGAH